MKSIYFDLSISKFLLTRIVGTVWNGVYYSSISPVSFGDLKEGPLPGPRWIRVKNILSGICGTDLSVFFLELNPRISLAALPGLSRVFLGHEICGEVVDVGPEVTRLRLGDRVVLQRSLHCCFAKEIEPRCQQCQQGNYGLCENQSEGSFPNNIGGGWSELFLAHESQLVPVPDDISTEEAVLIEPAAVALHAILRKEPQVNDKVLIVGAGIIGLLILHTIKQLQPGCHVSVIARHNYQQEMAEELKADRILAENDLYQQITGITNAHLYKGKFRNQMLLGGFDKIYDCVGKAHSIHNVLRWCKAGGTVVLVGVDLNPSKFDYTPLVFQETELIGCFGHGMETYDGERISTFDLVIGLMKEKRLNLNNLVTHRFRLRDYRKALEAVTNKRNSHVIKAVFEFD